MLVCMEFHHGNGGGIWKKYNVPVSVPVRRKDRLLGAATASAKLECTMQIEDLEQPVFENRTSEASPALEIQDGGRNRSGVEV